MNKLLKFIFPFICSVCEEREPLDERYICNHCLDQIEFTKDGNCPLCGSDFDSFLNICNQCIDMKRPWVGGGAPLRFEGQSREVIHKFKYNSQLVHSRFLVAEMAKYIKSHDMPEFSAITMVPLHWYRQWRRGYNQAEILARGISKELNIPCRKLLKKKQWSSAQARKNKQQRQKNITHIFNVPERQKPPKGAILLVDDVMTTGATLTACSKALINAGADQIYVLTAARG